jgi:hypothetical protein
MITVVSGIRDLARSSHHTVEHVVHEELQRRDLAVLRFGGALGVDTVALLAAAEARPSVALEVFVPWTISSQPVASREAIQRSGARVVELRLADRTKAAFLRRNDSMLNGADRLLAFTDGRTTGGTHYTICGANLRRLDVRTIRVAKLDRLRCQVCNGPLPCDCTFMLEQLAGR